MTASEALTGFTLSWRVDGLGLFFAVLVLAIAAPVTLYAIGHRRHERVGFPGGGFLHGLFVLAMIGVALAGDAFTFLIAWETMSLASFGLVLADHRRPEVRRAAWIYLVMTHTATACITAAFLLLANSAGSLEFAAWTAAAPALDARVAGLVFGLGLIGFGTKAGAIPLHIWLPRAHPVAASAISALMSGVMIKLGIYGLLRLGFDWLAPGPLWWGALVIVIGAVSAILGVLYALMQHDLKRLLAYHSVENIGIILLGAGVALGARATRADALVALGLSAALFHVVNHAVFKALLFLGAGAIDGAVGSRELGRLGGLVHRMPATALCFFVGSAAISALPPLNGFASEWLTFQALLGLGRGLAPSAVALFPLLAGGALALTGALAVACFVKAFGISFLGLPRSDASAGAREVGPLEVTAMVVLALACVGLGLAAGPVTRVIASVLPQGTAGGTLGILGGAGTPIAARLFVPGISVALAGLAVVTLGAVRLLGPVGSRREPTWASGGLIRGNNQYSALAFAKPLRLMFRDIVRPIREIEVVHHGESRFVASVHYRSHIAPVFERYLYGALTGSLVRASHVIRRAQNGSLQTYLAYVFVALIVALVLAQ
ncbi:MAG TPA: proton-conducting transporter membrane subunit [Candidatus Limnocylindria bacterium]|nr:proton-conducting transporter membrane subunit [Candidatus Limnocylindria bacterium]